MSLNVAYYRPLDSVQPISILVYNSVDEKVDDHSSNSQQQSLNSEYTSQNKQIEQPKCFSGYTARQKIHYNSHFYTTKHNDDGIHKTKIHDCFQNDLEFHGIQRSRMRQRKTEKTTHNNITQQLIENKTQRNKKETHDESSKHTIYDSDISNVDTQSSHSVVSIPQTRELDNTLHFESSPSLVVKHPPSSSSSINYNVLDSFHNETQRVSLVSSNIVLNTPVFINGDYENEDDNVVKNKGIGKYKINSATQRDNRGTKYHNRNIKLEWQGVYPENQHTRLNMTAGTRDGQLVILSNTDSYYTMNVGLCPLNKSENPTFSTLFNPKHTLNIFHPPNQSKQCFRRENHDMIQITPTNQVLLVWDVVGFCWLLLNDVIGKTQHDDDAI